MNGFRVSVRYSSSRKMPVPTAKRVMPAKMTSIQRFTPRPGTSQRKTRSSAPPEESDFFIVAECSR